MTLQALLDVINGAIQALNDNKHYLRDDENPEYYLKEVCYDHITDEIYCKFEEGQNE